MDGGAQSHRKKPRTKKPSKPSKPAHRKRSHDLSDKTVLELRKIAKTCGAKQTNPDGSTKTKQQLKSAINRAK